MRLIWKSPDRECRDGVSADVKSLLMLCRKDVILVIYDIVWRLFVLLLLNMSAFLVVMATFFSSLWQAAFIVTASSKNGEKELMAEEKVFSAAFRLARRSVWMYPAPLVDLLVNTPIKPQ